MYSREMGGIQSDGQLYGMNRPAPVPEREEPAAETVQPANDADATQQEGQE